MSDTPRSERDGGLAGDRDADTPTTTTSSTPATPFTQQAGRVLIVALAVLFGIFAVANSQFVDFSWVFGGTEVVESGGERSGGGVPLILLLLAAFLFGAAIGALVLAQRARHHRRDRATKSD